MRKFNKKNFFNTENIPLLMLYTIDHFFGNRPEYREYIDLYGKIHGLDRYALLAADGDTNGKWVYFDGKKEYAVQSWINKVDGKYSGLLLCVCNPGSHSPKSKKSILVVPDSDIDFTGIYAGRDPIFSLLVPRIGELDIYTVGYEMEQLKKQLD
ncbi:hypothetical protein HZC32_03060 [Candidatus Woesearchaeota archaeon]|nr:hypothetical protein [Candidatus Woesearchaeota archaeon]